MRVLMLLPPKRPAFWWPLLCALFRRRLKPSRLPHPIHDGFTTTFYSGLAIGAVLVVCVAVIALKGIR